MSDGVLPLDLFRRGPNNTIMPPSVDNAARHRQRSMEDP